jgi:hypothetical protein
MIKSGRMRWSGHVARIGDRKGAYRFWWGELMERDHMEDLGINGRIILKLIFKKWYGEAWIPSIRLRIGTDGRLL